MPPRTGKPPEIDIGPQWTDISLSDVPPLPPLPKQMTISNPQFLARSLHSRVYIVDLTDRQKTTRDNILKIFPKPLKLQSLNEVNAYRLLYHYDVQNEGVVHKVFGVLPSISKKKLDAWLEDAIPENYPIALPAPAITVEYL